MTATVIERGPPEIDFDNVTVGTDEKLNWILGKEVNGTFVPDNLTGRAAEIIFDPGSMEQIRQPCQIDGPAGEVFFILGNTIIKTTGYLVLLEDQPGGRKAPLVAGTIIVGRSVRP